MWLFSIIFCLARLVKFLKIVAVECRRQKHLAVFLLFDPFRLHFHRNRFVYIRDRPFAPRRCLRTLCDIKPILRVPIQVVHFSTKFLLSVQNLLLSNLLTQNLQKIPHFILTVSCEIPRNLLNSKHIHFSSV